jgi:hypothetical protein
MNLCGNCGVELEEGFKVCPLCGKSTGEKAEEPDEPGNYPSDIIRLHRKESRKYVWELSGIIAFSCIVICTIVDLVIVRGVRWSLFADTSILTAWVLFTLIMFVLDKPFVFITCLLAAIISMLFLFDLISPPLNWFLKLGMPLALGACLLFGIVVLLYRLANFRGVNIIAIIFLVSSAFCIIVEVFVDLYLNGQIDLLWSPIEAVSALPVALIFFFIHYRLKRGKRLDSFFHV